MRAIVSVIGRDRVGIIAEICAILAEYGINILDISQTILNGSFTMVMLVDAAGSTVPFVRLSEILRTAGEERSLEVRIQREEIFDAMHRI